jgi:hypothetical protein
MPAPRTIAIRPVKRLIRAYSSRVVQLEPGVAVSGSAGVASFNTRTGAVVPASGDYTAAQIAETAAAKILTADERTKLANIEAGAEVNAVDSVFGRTGAVVATADDYSLDQIGSPAVNKTFSMANKTLKWAFTNPAGGILYEFTGAASGHLLEILQTGGNPTADAHLLHIEASDADPLMLHLVPGAAASRAIKTNIPGENSGPGRLVIDASGKLSWGNGTDALDVTLSRSGAGALTIVGSLAYTNQASAARAALQLPVVALGTISGTQAIDWAGEGQAVTATIDGTAYEFTEGTGWPASALAEVRLLLTVATPAAGTWTIAPLWINPPSSFAVGTHVIVLSKMAGSMIAVYGGMTEALA